MFANGCLLNDSLFILTNPCIEQIAIKLGSVCRFLNDAVYIYNFIKLTFCICLI